jgi:hypothetical protein
MRRTKPTAALRLAVALVVAPALATSCVGPDPEFPPPIAPQPRAAWTRIEVAPVINEAPSPTVAQWSYETHRTLEHLLTRSRRFEVTGEGGGGLRLDVRFVDVRDEAYNETIVFGREQEIGAQRRAVVEMRFRVGDGPFETVISEEFQDGALPLPLPTAAELESGSFFETPYGRAIRKNLDLVVRRLAAGPS